MADGVWNAGLAQEKVSQAQFIRHRILRINTGSIALNPGDASGFGATDPPSIVPGDVTAPPTGPQGGPHFIMSGVTTDDKPTYGFEFCIAFDGIDGGEQATALAGGFTVTPWIMIGNTQVADSSFAPVWAEMEATTGVAERELFHSFDINAEAIRFQISNVDADGSILLIFAEL